jgi:hypothetical protein
MKPPNSFRNLLSGLPAASDGTGRVGPTMAAQRARIPQDLEELNAPRRPRMMTQDELVDMAMDVSSPMGMVAGATRKAAAPVARSIAERIPTLYHGTNAEPFFKFLREKMGKGLNKLGVAGYGTDAAEEGVDYIKTRLPQAQSQIITGRGTPLDVPMGTATFLRSGELSLEDAITKQQKSVDSWQKLFNKYKAGSKTQQRYAGKLEDAKATLYNLLTAADEGIGEIRRPGTLLELGIDADKSKLLNFDRDLIDQTPFVQRAVLDAVGIKGPVNPYSREQMFEFNNLLNSGIRTREGSKMLEDAGIQGVMAASSMNPGVKNYAIFDPDRIAVLRALGLLGLLTGGARGAASPSQEQEPL